MDNIFPKFPADDFYKQFDDPLRAFWNLPGLYNFYLENPCNERSEIDHINYARALADKHNTTGSKELLPKKQLLKEFKK